MLYDKSTNYSLQLNIEMLDGGKSRLKVGMKNRFCSELYDSQTSQTLACL